MRGVGYGSPASPWSSAYLDSPMSRGSDRADMPVNSRVRVKLGLDFQHFREGDCGTVTSVKADSIREVLFDDQAVPLPVARRHLELLEGRSPVASGRVSPKPRPPQPAPGAAMPLPGRPRSPLQPRSPLGGAPSPASGAGAYGADSPVGRWPLSPERQPTSGFGTYAADSPLRHRPLSPGPTGGPGARAADSPARLRPLSPAGTHGAETPVRQRPFSPDSHTRYPIDVTTNSVLRGESGRSPSPSHLSGSLGRRAVSSTTSPTMASSEAASLLASLREERRAREALELQVKKLVENNGHYNQILASKEADALKENDTLRRSVEELRRQLAQEREERRLLRDDKQDVGGPGTQALSPRLGGASYGYGGKPCVGTPLGGSFGTQGLRSAEQAVYVADNSCLHAKTPGIHYRLSTTLNSLDDPGNLLRWGSKVSGIECMGGEWLKVEGHGYLPMRLDGVQVLKRKATRGSSWLPSCFEGVCGTASGPSRSPSAQTAGAIVGQASQLGLPNQKAVICIVGATGLRPVGPGSEFFCKCRIRDQKVDAAVTARRREQSPVWESGHELGFGEIAGRKLDFELYSSQTGEGRESVSYLGKATMSVDTQWLGVSETFEVDLPLSRFCCGAGSLKVRLFGVKPVRVKAHQQTVKAATFEELDANGDGKISRQEFLNAYREGRVKFSKDGSLVSPCGSPRPPGQATVASFPARLAGLESGHQDRPFGDKPR